MDFTLTPEIAFLIGLAVFWVVLYVLAYVFHLEKYGLEVQPAFFMYKSKALNSFLDKVANKRRTLWLILSNIGLAFSIGLMILGIFYFLINNLLRLILQPVTQAATPFILLIPVLTIRLYWLPYFFLAVVIIVLTHELAHGIVARLENIPILSSGILAFLVFFGAFVEQDEKEFEKASLLARLRMLAAGSSTNLITALLVTLLMTGLFVPTPAGFLIQEVTPTGPADRAGLQQWDVIKAINGTPILNIQNYSDYMNKIKPNTPLTITVLHANNEKLVKITTAADPTNSSRAILGLLGGYDYHTTRLGLDQYSNVNLYWTLFWLYLLGISVAIFNMLPAFPFDGERVLYYPLTLLVKKRKRELRWTLSIVIWGLFLLNTALNFWRYGFLRI
jgi:membrane-associated protease RseP (regulator of RpoE activity)